MELQEALDIISEALPDTAKELVKPNTSFDTQLILEIAQSIKTWRSRVRKIKDPYVVWFFDGATWSKTTEDMYQNEAYREWYRLTKGGTENHTAKYETYYLLDSTDKVLSGRYEEDEEEDDFSIGYLLNKSFGE